MLKLIFERSKFDNTVVQAFWIVSLGFSPVVILIAMCLVIHWRAKLFYESAFQQRTVSYKCYTWFLKEVNLIILLWKPSKL